MKSIKILKTSFFALLTFSLLSCSKSDDDTVPVQQQSIADIVSSNNDFSLLKVAVVHANLVNTLDGNGSFTVFAPNNAAFQKAGLTTEASIKALPAETVKSIILYHALGSKATSTSLPTASNTAVKTLQESEIFVTKNNNGVFINGAKVNQADVNAENGIIHVIDKVLMPASGNLVATLANNTNFSYLVAAVLRASQGTTNVRAALEAAGPLTVFAPTNQAFIAAGFPTVESIQAANPETLTTILLAHVLNGRVFSNAVENNLSVNTIGQAPIVFNTGSAVTVKGNGNSTAANITSFDLLATNGVIHIIDKVILP